MDARRFPGEVIFSRDESNPSGRVEAKVVEEVFERFGPVLHLHVGGQVIRTTAEHPFFAYVKGWIAAQDLLPDDYLLSETGEWKRVEEIFDTGEWEPVYNLRVAHWHTYFVGEESWGWACWSHNHTACAIIRFREQHDLPKITPNEAEPEQNSYRGTVAHIKLSTGVQFGLNPNAGGRDRLVNFKLQDTSELERFRLIINSTPGRTFDTIPQVLRHAEFAALYLANEQRGPVPSRIKMDTDRTLCPFDDGCLDNLHRVLSAFGIECLLIRDNYGDVYRLSPHSRAALIGNMSLQEWATFKA